MRPQAEIDLHGMTLEEAYGALVTFFEDSVRRKYQKNTHYSREGKPFAERPCTGTICTKISGNKQPCRRNGPSQRPRRRFRLDMGYTKVLKSHEAVPLS